MALVYTESLPRYFLKLTYMIAGCVQESCANLVVQLDPPQGAVGGRRVYVVGVQSHWVGSWGWSPPSCIFAEKG